MIALLAGCATTRDFYDPQQRITDATAYALSNREVRVDTGLLGTGVQDLGANIDVAVGVGRGAQVSTNAAHLSLGIINASTKYTFVDRPRFGLGAQASFLWTRPTLIWLLPNEVTEPLKDIDLLIVPLELTASFPLARWVSLHLGGGYTHAELFGRIGNDASYFNAGLGARMVHLEPVVHFYLGNRVALILGGEAPVYLAAVEQVRSDIELEEGVVLGVRSAEWVAVPVGRAARGRLGVELRLGRRAYLQLFVARSALSNAGGGPPVLPSINAYWRL